MDFFFLVKECNLKGSGGLSSPISKLSPWAILSDLQYEIQPWVFSLKSIFKLKKVATIFLEIALIFYNTIKTRQFMIMTITPKRKTFESSSFEMISRVCFSENLLGINLLFRYQKLKYNQVYQAFRKHYLLISSNLRIKKILKIY